jgi:hypothetical protein
MNERPQAPTLETSVTAPKAIGGKITLTMLAFHDGWRELLADQLMRGINRDKIVAEMKSRGFPELFVTQQINAIEHEPAFRAGRKVFIEKRKLQSLLTAYGTQFRQSRFTETFVKKNGLSAAEFYEHYYFPNRPVVVGGLIKDWTAPLLWTPEYFAEKYGNCEVEITSGRNGDPKYEENFRRHRSKIRMTDYVRMVREGGETNDYYLVAQNHVLSRPEFRELYDHFRCPEGFLDSSKLQGHVRLWFGPKGTVTPLHHDGRNILFAQIYGRKRVRLIAPYDIERVYNDREWYSAVDLDAIDYKRFPLMRGVPVLDFILEPGEFLLLPVGWWHWVKSLDVSISLSFLNFRVEGNGVVWE